MQSEFCLVAFGFVFCGLTGGGVLICGGGGVFVMTGFVVVGSVVGFGVSSLPLLTLGATDGVTDGEEAGVLVAETVADGEALTFAVVLLSELYHKSNPPPAPATPKNNSRIIGKIHHALLAFCAG